MQIVGTSSGLATKRPGMIDRPSKPCLTRGVRLGHFEAREEVLNCGRCNFPHLLVDQDGYLKKISKSTSTVPRKVTTCVLGSATWGSVGSVGNAECEDRPGSQETWPATFLP